MRIILITIGLILAGTSVLNATENNEPATRIIGLNIYHIHSASGWGSSVNMNLSIEKEQRHLEMGIVLQDETARIMGGEVIYRHYLSNANKKGDDGHDQFRNLRIYLQYNFIFRNTTRHGLIDAHSPLSREEAIENNGRIATFEHYAGVGAQVKLFDNMFLNAGVGYGTILGSVDEKFLNEPHYTASGNKNDFGFVTRFGLGYYFRK